MPLFNYSNFFGSTKGKVIAVLIVACLAGVLSWSVIHGVFRNMVSTLEEVSKPDRKLTLINSIFRSVIELQQREGEQIFVTNAYAENAFLQHTRRLEQSLDSLQTYFRRDSLQRDRLQSMKRLLREREWLWLRYRKLRQAAVDTTSIAQQMESLGELITAGASIGDTSVVTTQNKITTTYLPLEDSAADETGKKNQSLWKRIFSKKKLPKERELRKIVKEELRTKIDTLSVAQRDSIIHEIRHLMDSIEKGQVQRSHGYVLQEVTLVKANNKIINQLFELTHEVERDALIDLKNQQQSSARSVGLSLDKFELIIVAFLIVMVILVIFILFDLTRSARYRKELQTAKEGAEYLGQVKQRFLANMSHELRTPLQSIIGFSEQLRSGSEPGDQTMVRAIHQSSEHLLQIINEALDYSRIVSGKFSFERKPFNMAALLAEVSEIMKMQAIAKKLKFTFKTEVNERQFLLGDAFRLRQILYNVIGNAVKFTASGEIDLLIRQNDVGNKAEFSFSIKDTGKGISEDEALYIFLPFEQASENTGKPHDGTGLGLSITKELVENQGGTIKMTSTPGKGSCFLIALSYELTSPLAETTTSPYQQHGNFEGKVVLVDDDQYIRKLASMVLEKHGIVYKVFPSAEAFIQSPWDTNTKTILLDIRMPGMSGIELCKWIRLQNGMAVKVVAMTAEILPEEHQRILQSGFDAIVIKPFKEKDILDQLKAEVQDIGNNDFSLSTVFQMAQGDEELFFENLQIFVEETVGDLMALRDAMAICNTRHVAALLHKLAGRFGQVDAKTLWSRLRFLENALRNGGSLKEYQVEIESSCLKMAAITDKIREVASKAKAI